MPRKERDDEAMAWMLLIAILIAAIAGVAWVMLSGDAAWGPSGG